MGKIKDYVVRAKEGGFIVSAHRTGTHSRSDLTRDSAPRFSFQEARKIARRFGGDVVHVGGSAKQKVNDFSERFRGAGQSFAQRLLPSRNVSRRAQLLAAMLLPFVIVCAMAGAEVFHGVVFGIVGGETTLGGIVLFLVGLGCVIGVIAFCFFWVSSGGIGLFD